MSTDLQVASFFSGIGGIDLTFERAGADVRLMIFGDVSPALGRTSTVGVHANRLAAIA